MIQIKRSFIKALCLLYPFFCVSQNWEISTLASLPEGVSNNAVESCVVDGVPFVYSFSGIDSTKIYSGIHLKSWKYNTVTDEWIAIDPLPDELGKIAAGASRVNDVIYIIGGYNVFEDGSEKTSSKVHRYDILTDTYLPDGADIPVATDDHVQAVWRDSLIFVVTGWSNTTNINNVQIYNPIEDAWRAGTPVPNNDSYKSFGASGAIVGDTIYYFGGAGSFGAFPVQEHFRKGVINPDNPTAIRWSVGTIANNSVGYRIGATSIGEHIYWIGGSGITYNFDGIAYNGTGGVPPLNRILRFNTTTEEVDIDNYNLIPMDLRGIASVDDTVKYIVGGMVENQKVSNQLFKLTWKGDQTTSISNVLSSPFKIHLSPNPVKDILNLSIFSKTNTKVEVVIYNELGQLVKQLSSSLNVGENNLKLEMDSFHNGWHLLSIETNRGRVIEKLLIAK